MPRYRYTAIDAEGNRTSGELDATSTDEAMARLAAEQLKVESLETAASVAGDASLKRLSDQEVADLTQHIAGITRRGLPLASGLRALADELPGGSLRRLLWEISDQLDAGTSLEDALRAQGHRLPAHLQGLVMAGAGSGRLGEVLEQHVKYLNVGAELKRQIGVALAYPTVLLVVLGVLYVVISVWIVSAFKKIFMDFGVELPGVTLIMLAVADFAVEAWPWVLVGLFVGIPAIWLIAEIFLGPPGRQRLTYRIPLVGPVLRWSSLAKFSHLVGLLAESEMLLPTAIRLAGEGIRDPEIADACRGVVRDIEAGQSLSDSVVLRTRFPSDLAQILSWGEGQQSMAEAMHIAGEMFEGRARLHTTFVMAVVTPLAFIVVVWGLGLLVIGLFMPLIKLITELSG